MLWSQRLSPAEKAKRVGPIVVETCDMAPNRFIDWLRREQGVRLDSKIANFVRVEVMLFIYHIFDRLALDALGAQGRSVFMDSVFAQLLASLLSEDTGIAALFQQLGNVRQSEYAKYRDWFPKSGKPTRDTLFWEFSKKLTGMITKKEPAEHLELLLALNVYFSSVILSVLKKTDVVKILKQ